MPRRLEYPVLGAVPGLFSERHEAGVWTMKPREAAEEGRLPASRSAMNTKESPFFQPTGHIEVKNMITGPKARLQIELKHAQRLIPRRCIRFSRNTPQ